jgi:DNA invertase Pin-like site-specific DNA recombinase
MNSIACYVRGSTDRQTCEMQIAECERIAQARGWTLAWYMDRGESGAKRSRPELDRLIGDVRAGKVKAVLVYRLDRLARSLGHMVLLMDELRARGVDVVSATEALDTTTPTGRLQVGIIAVFAEYEREIIRERVISGQRRARAQGKVIGRKPKPIDLDRAVALRRAGRSWRSISRAVKVKLATVRRRVLAAAGEDPAPDREAPQEGVPNTSRRLGEAGIASDAALGRG